MAENAKFGYAAFKNMGGKLPNPFPRTMGPNVLKYVTEVVESGLTSDMVERFEQAFAKKMGKAHTVSAPGCSNALYCLAEGLSFPAGSEIIFSPITDFGTLLGFYKTGYIPVFADTAPGSMNVSAETISKKITERTRAIVVVHFSGLMCDMDPIVELAKKHNLVLVEDACQAIMSTYKGRLAGTIGDVGAFSFDSEKNVGSDVGGCFITDNSELDSRARFTSIARGGEVKPGYGRVHTFPGSAFRMPLLTAAFTLGQLDILDEVAAKRNHAVRTLLRKVSTIPGILIEQVPDYQEVYSSWMFGFRIEPDAFSCTTEEFGVECDALGFTGLSPARYYLIPEACVFLQKDADAGSYPFNLSKESYNYDADETPNAKEYMSGFLRSCYISEKFTDDYVEIAYQIIKEVADKYRM